MAECPGWLVRNPPRKGRPYGLPILNRTHSPSPIAVFPYERHGAPFVVLALPSNEVRFQP